MKIVIDIDENLYTRLFDNGVDDCDNAVDMAKAIRKGTPLPKGHGDLIDRGKTVKRICKVADFMNERRENLGSPYIMAALFIQDNKEEFPTIIEADKEEENEGSN